MSLLARARARLSAEGWFGLQLLGGAVAIIGAAFAFGLLAHGVTADEPLTLLDAQITKWFHERARSPYTEAMLAVSLVNGYTGTVLLSVVFAAFLARKREWGWIVLLALAVPGGMVINTLAKLAFHRPRPVFDEPLVVLSTFSFPSGHTLSATVFYGTLAAYLTPRVRASVRPWLWLAAFTAVSLVALSRVYLGAHYLSDVIAAFVEGFGWLACCLVALSTYRWRVQRRSTLTADAAR